MEYTDLIRSIANEGHTVVNTKTGETVYFLHLASRPLALGDWEFPPLEYHVCIFDAHGDSPRFALFSEWAWDEFLKAWDRSSDDAP